MKRLLAVFILLSIGGILAVDAQKKKAVPAKPVPIIFDTDIGPDYDDVGAITMLHAFADSGEAKILATIASNKNPPIAAVLNVYNTYFNRPTIPIGVPKGDGVNLPAKQGWDTIVAARYPHTIDNNEAALDAVV